MVEDHVLPSVSSSAEHVFAHKSEIMGDVLLSAISEARRASEKDEFRLQHHWASSAQLMFHKCPAPALGIFLLTYPSCFLINLEFFNPLRLLAIVLPSFLKETLVDLQHPLCLVTPLISVVH